MMSAETPVGRRLREMARTVRAYVETHGDDPLTSRADCDAIDAGCDAIALLRRIADGDIDESRIVKAAADFLDRIA